jgi:hypothetical protein
MRICIDARTGTMIRTVWFLVAMIPLLLLVGLMGMFSLVLVSPLIIYAGLKGTHLKDPLRKKNDQYISPNRVE